MVLVGLLMQNVCKENILFAVIIYLNYGILQLLVCNFC